MSSILNIALPTPLRRLFDYLPLSGQPLPPIGARVCVNFRGKPATGVVLGISDSTQVPQNKLKPVLKYIDSQPIFSEPLLATLRWAGRYYHHSQGDVINAALPKLIRQGEPASAPPLEHWTITELGQQAMLDIPANAVRQRQALELLQSGSLAQADLTAAGITTSTINTLADKGWMTKVVVHSRAYLPSSVAKNRLPLNGQQQRCLDALLPKFGDFAPALLHGVTGSGKTEVYMRLLEPVLEAGQQGLILVPEIGLTPQLIERFKRRFRARFGIWHSGINDNQRLRLWQDCHAGQVDILIGTRSAVFAPLNNLGLIVVDEEHDLSYKQQDGFRYSARDLAVYRAKSHACPIVLGSATPSIESAHHARNQKYQLLELSERAADAKPPAVSLLDIRKRHLWDGLSQPLIDKITEHLERGNQSLLFLNRRGFSPAWLCHHCGWVANCRRCDMPMTLHQKFHKLQCHHCGNQARQPEACPACEESEFVPVGVGTERLEESVKARFPDARVLRVDRDTTSTKGAMTQYMNAVKNDEVDILVGTQMLAKGHHFPRLALVGILDVDGCLFSADFRASERTAQLITQVAGRAGRGETRGEVVLQTHHPEHPLFMTLLTRGYDAFLTDAIAERNMAMLPPASHMALIRAEATQASYPSTFLSEVRQLCQQFLSDHDANSNELQILGPVPSPMPLRAGRYRMQLLLQSTQRALLHQTLQHLTYLLEVNAMARKVRWSLDVDPQEMY